MFEVGDAVVEADWSGTYPRDTVFYVEEVFQNSAGEWLAGVRPYNLFSAEWELFAVSELVALN